VKMTERLEALNIAKQAGKKMLSAQKGLIRG
jgi:hypothetical protein